MPRTPLTRNDRALSVRQAAAQLPNLLAEALTLEASGVPNAPQTLAAWEAVENVGATIHRQARLLAGKSRGG